MVIMRGMEVDISKKEIAKVLFGDEFKLPSEILKYLSNE